MLEKQIVRFNGGVEVTNLDEIKAHLTNELNRIMKPLLVSLNRIIVATNENKPSNKVIVENQLEIPSEVSISNLDDLSSKLSSILDALQTLPSPQVTVEQPAINLPAPIVNIPQQPEIKIDLSQVIKELNLGLNRLRTNTPDRPLVVRLKEGDAILKALNNLNVSRETSKGTFQGVAFSGGASVLVDSTGSRINPATAESTDSSRGGLSNQASITVNSTAVKVSVSSGKKSMTIQNTGTKIIYIGGVGVSSSSYAYKIVPMQIQDFGKVKFDFNFYAVCSGADTSTIGVGEYA